MGHVRLGELPRTRKWDEVVELIVHDGDAAAVSAAAVDAADAGFRAAAEDEGVGYATWLLTQPPLAARDPNYLDRLRAMGMPVVAAPALMDVPTRVPLADHVPDRYRHNVRYFGLLAPWVKSRTHDVVFAALGQKRLGKPRRLRWATSLQKSFGVDPLVDGDGGRMRWVGRVPPRPAAALPPKMGAVTP